MLVRIQRLLKRNPTLVLLATFVFWWTASCITVYTVKVSNNFVDPDISVDLENEQDLYDETQKGFNTKKILRRDISPRTKSRNEMPKLYLDTRRSKENGEDKKMDVDERHDENIIYGREMIRSKDIRKLKINTSETNDQNIELVKEISAMKTLVTIVCGTNQRPDEYQRNIFARQLNQTKTMLKSLVYFSSSSSFKVVLVTDTLDTYKQVLQQIEDWPPKYRSRLYFERAALWKPATDDPQLLERWRPCSWSKLFLLESLPSVEAALYVDTDILFLAPAEGLWETLAEMKPPQSLALGPDPLYDRHKHRRYAGSVGLSAGLMVMNFTSLRAFKGERGNFTKTILHYKDSFANYHDQDTLNTFLADHPSLFRELGARWNFSPSQCIAGVLPCCTDTGVAVIHGFDATFVRGVEMVFQAIYESLLALDLNASTTSLLSKIEDELFRVDRYGLQSTCKKVWGIQDILLKHIRELAAAERGG